MTQVYEDGGCDSEAIRGQAYRGQIERTRGPEWQWDWQDKKPPRLMTGSWIDDNKAYGCMDGFVSYTYAGIYQSTREQWGEQD